MQERPLARDDIRPREPSCQGAGTEIRWQRGPANEGKYGPLDDDETMPGLPLPFRTSAPAVASVGMTSVASLLVDWGSRQQKRFQDLCIALYKSVNLCSVAYTQMG
jgi:hypothetical protein